MPRRRRTQRPVSPPAAMPDLLARIFQRFASDDAKHAYQIWLFWKDEVGEAIAERAKPSGYHAGVLSVSVAGHAWLQELQFMKEEIRERLNARLGKPLIRDIYFVSGPRRRRARPAPPRPRRREPLPELPSLEDPELRDLFGRIMQAHATRGRQQ